MTTLEGISEKIARADEELQLLNADISQLCDDQGKYINHEVLLNAGEQVWVFRGETPKVPIRWFVRVGEIAYNLRSALDHLIWQLVLANGHNPGRHNTFPVVTSSSNWEGARGSLNGVSPRSEAQIKYLQPYTGGIGLDFDVSNYSRLDSLCNIDKHRHLNSGIVALRNIKPLISEADLGKDPPFQGWSYLGKLERDKVVLRLRPPDREVRASFDIRVHFEDTQKPEFTHVAVTDTLRDCLVAVRKAVALLRNQL